MMMRSALAVALAMSLWSGSADAAPITFSYTGDVSFVGLWDSALPVPEPAFGTSFSGTYTFDSTALDGVPADPTTGSYTSSGGSFGLTFELAGLTFGYSSVSIGVTDGYSSFGFGDDQYLVGFSDGTTSLSFRLTDSTEAMFSGDALPLAPPDLTGLFTEFFFTDGSQIDFGGTITSLTCIDGCAPAVVPEPATLSLMATGLGALAHRRRRRS